MRVCALILFALLSSSALAADPLNVAVASNFSRTADELAHLFSAETGIEIRYSRGSTGKLYAQIIHGAPFQVFLAADAWRPELLEGSGHAVTGSRFTYAVGSLVLWSRDDGDCHEDLLTQRYTHLAIANPDTAPYGKAAREFLAGEGLWEAASDRAVYGENIGQTLQFVATGNADLGLVARSQLTNTVQADVGCRWPVPASSHAPLEHQAVVLAQGGANAQRFAEFLRSDKARQIIGRHGYEVTP